MPIGTKLEITESVLMEMEDKIRDEVESYEKLITTVGGRSLFGFLGSVQTHTGSIQIQLLPFSERTETTEEIQQKVRSHFNDFPSAVFSLSGSTNMMGTSPIDIIVKTDDLERGKEIAENIRLLLDN